MYMKNEITNEIIKTPYEDGDMLTKRDYRYLQNALHTRSEYGEDAAITSLDGEKVSFLWEAEGKFFIININWK